ncbi:hypothetical protein ACK3XG_15355 [Bacillus sp. TD10]|uniref:hypothetical protein n=1 Tax=Bacillus TaxID=1386 RepID=UPI00301488DD
MIPYSCLPFQLYSGQIIPVGRQMFGRPQIVPYPVFRTVPFKRWISWERFRQLDELAPAGSAHTF